MGVVNTKVGADSVCKEVRMCVHWSSTIGDPWMPTRPPYRNRYKRAKSRPEADRLSPERGQEVVHVRVLDERRPGIVVRLRVYDVRRGTLIRES